MPAVIFQDTERASSCNILRPNYIILVSTFSSLASESHHTTRSISSSILQLLYVPSIKSEKKTWLGYHLLLRCSYEMFLPPHGSIFYIIDTCMHYQCTLSIQCILRQNSCTWSFAKGTLNNYQAVTVRHRAQDSTSPQREGFPWAYPRQQLSRLSATDQLVAHHTTASYV